MDYALYKHLAAIIESSNDAIISKDLNGLITSWNRGAEAIFGYTAVEVIGAPVSQLIPADHLDESADYDARLQRGEAVAAFESQRLTRRGQLIDVSLTLSPIHDDAGALVGISCIARDITPLKQREREIARLSRLYAALSQINQAIVRMPDRDTLFREVCRVLVEHGGFRMAWIGWHQADISQIAVIASWGDDLGCLQGLRGHTDGRAENCGLSGMAFRSGKPYVSNDLHNDPMTRTWQKTSQQNGYRSGVALPIQQQGEPCGTLSVYSDQRDFFNDKEISLLIEVAADLSFALDNAERDTARQSVEQKLLNEKRFSDTMIDSMPGILYFYDYTGRFLRWNHNFESVSGYSGEQIATMHPLDFFAGDDHALLEQRIATVFAQGESSVVADFVSSNGARTPYYFTGRRVEFDGVPCLIGVGMDITERKRAEDRLREVEDRFRELAETVQEVFWINDPVQERFLYISPAFEKVWGRDSAALYENPASLIDTIHPDDRERVLQLMHTDHTRREREDTYRVVRPDGSIRWIRQRAFHLFDGDGQMRRIVGTAEDVTERRQLEEQFNQAQKMQAIGQLAAGVAHDFNNILAAILGNTQLALQDVAAEHPAAKSLEEIRRASLRGKSLVQQILAFSQQQRQERQVIELGATVQEAVALLRAIIPSSVDIVTNIDPATPPVLADATQINQVVINLCTNSWHALGDQPGRIEITLQGVLLDATAAGRLTGMRPGNVACLTVSDTGSGMNAATLACIFEPFFTTKPPGEGTGLGLSVVHGIVQRHDGAISVNSNVGVGTVVKVYFPAAAAAVVTPTEMSASHRGTGQHILYIDDEESLVFLAKRMLERLGYRVTGFVRPLEALQAFRDNPEQFDLAITDLNMPGVSGLRVATEMRKLRPDMPIALCSGHVTEELKQQALKAGINKVLYKPNTMEELSGVIHELATAQK